MTVHGPNDGGIRPDLRTDQSAASRAARIEAQTPDRTAGQTPAADRVDLSSEARELASSQAVPAGELEAARLRDVADKVAEGHYNKPEVLEQVARRILDTLRSQPGS